MLPSCGPRKCGTISIPLSRAESEEGDSFPRTGQPAQEAISLTLAGCCGVGSEAEKLVSFPSVFPYKRILERYNSLDWDLSGSFSSQL